MKLTHLNRDLSCKSHSRFLFRYFHDSVVVEFYIQTKKQSRRNNKRLKNDHSEITLNDISKLFYLFFMEQSRATVNLSGYIPTHTHSTSSNMLRWNVAALLHYRPSEQGPSVIRQLQNTSAIIRHIEL